MKGPWHFRLQEWRLGDLVLIELLGNTNFLQFFLIDMRRDVQEIFRLTPHEKQCMMFSATLSKEIRPVCRKFMQDVCVMYSGKCLSEKENKGTSLRQFVVQLHFKEMSF